MPQPVPNLTATKRRGGMVRQLSLQGSAPPIASGRRGALRRQMSDDVSDKPDVQLRIGTEKTADRSPGSAGRVTRPKPRTAWAERRSESMESVPVEAVEVVARRCAGLPRPSSRTSRPAKLPLVDKESLILSRQQLAERLRRAWKDRDKKSNLDIVLAHSRPESSVSARSVLSEESLGFKMFEERLSYAEEQKENVPVEEVAVPPKEMSASERRASFKSSHFLNKTISGSFSDDEANGGEFKVFVNKVPAARPPLVRTSSAPTQRVVRVPSPSTTLQKSKPQKPTERKATKVVQMDFSGQEEDSQNRSQMFKRKIKVTSRKKTKECDDSSDEEDRDRGENKKPPRRRQLHYGGGNGSDIITMVSLVSPAESDVEEPPAPVLPPANGVKVCEPSSPEEVLAELPKENPSAGFILRNLRKTKTVSFQAHPPVSRSCSAHFPLRRVPPGAPIIIPTPITSNVPMSIHDKSSGQDRGTKRRLVRSNTLPSKDEEDTVSSSSDDVCRSTYEPNPVPPLGNLDKDNQQEEGEDDTSGTEPEIKTPKEKECWVLYKKMLDKGVSVSYDTVLRGMLTPTEYRLRKNQLARC